jgi:hypothetical protein
LPVVGTWPGYWAAADRAHAAAAKSASAGAKAITGG